MKIAKELEWFRPFIKAASIFVPVKRIKNIILTKPDINKLHRHQAQITDNGDGTFYISFYQEIYKLDRLPDVRKLSQYSKMELLCNLAHELAHLKEWEHTPAHKSLECDIIKLFMDMLLGQGYISEEDEYKYPPFK